MDNNWYYLDPDNNKPDPEKGMFCARCKRKLKETMAFEKFHSIVIHPYNPWFRMAKIGEGEDLIGSECLKKVIEEYGIMQEKTL